MAATPSQLLAAPANYDGKSVEVLGQAFSAGGTRALLDGGAGLNLSGDLSGFGGVCWVTGTYGASTNTLSVSRFVRESPTYNLVNAAKQLGASFVPVSVQGLIAPVPKQVSDKIASYISFPSTSIGLTIHPCVVFTNDGLYLALLSNPVETLTQVRFGTTTIPLCSGEIKGILVKTPLSSVSFGPGWLPSDFGGVVIGDSMATSNPISATVLGINSNYDSYAFRRVSIDASYLIATASLGPYGQQGVPVGLGVALDQFSDILRDNPRDALDRTVLTLNPGSNVWQLRRGQVTGTVIGPTKDILKYFKYLPDQGGTLLRKPVLIVDNTPTGQIITVNDIAQLNPISGNPSQYWGKVVQFEGYALGGSVSVRDALRDVCPVITSVHIDVAFSAMGVVKGLPVPPLPPAPPDLVLTGLQSEFSGLPEFGKYRFIVAVTKLPVPMASPLSSFTGLLETGYFVLKKELISQAPPPIPTPSIPPLPTPITVSLGDLRITPSPSPTPPKFGPPMPFPKPPLPSYADISVRLMAQNPTNAPITVSGIQYQANVNGKYAGSGSVATRYVVPSKGGVDMDSVFRANFDTVGDAIIRAMVGGRFTINLMGTATVASGSQTQTMQFSGVVQLP